MTVTALDPRTALVVIDLQLGILGMPAVHPVEQIRDRAAVLAAEFRRRGLPVVLVNVTGGAPGRTNAGPARPPGWTPPADWADLATELDAAPSDLLVTKRTWVPSTARPCRADLSPARRDRHDRRESRPARADSLTGAPRCSAQRRLTR